MISRKSSGSSWAERAVEPTRSQNITDSWRRSAVEVGVAATGGRGAAGAVDVAASLLPQFVQNLVPARLVAPQEVQRIGSAAPHSPQNLLSSGVSERQLGHSMSAPHCHFRGLLGLHSRYGPPDRSAAQGDLCHEAPAFQVTRTSRSSATRSIDSSLGGSLLHW